MPLRIILLILVMTFFAAACGGRNNTDGADEAANPDDAISRAASLAATCSGCHGEAGAAIVALSGYTTDEIVVALMAYKSDTSGSTVMHRLMRGYSDEDITSISHYLAAYEGN